MKGKGKPKGGKKGYPMPGMPMMPKKPGGKK